MSLTPEAARRLLDRFPGHRLLVVGDLMLDRYVEGRVRRISPEAPVPVLEVTGERDVPGGACNVGLNLVSLGGACALAGVVGRDANGERLARLLDEAGVGRDAMVEDAARPTITKTRVMADRQQIVRVDRERAGAPDPTALEALLRGIGDALDAGVSGVIVEDYGKGVVCAELVDRVMAVCAERGVPVGYDPKDNHALRIGPLRLATPNRIEALHAAGETDMVSPPPPTEDPALRRAGEQLLVQWNVDALLITLGPQGMMLFEPDRPPHHIPTRAREVFDVSGAGDSVIATCMLALCAGASPVEAAELANYAAGVVVGKVGTASCSPDELLARMEPGPA